MVGRQSFSRRFSRRFSSASDRLSWLPYLSYAKTTSWRMRSRPTMRIFGEVFLIRYDTKLAQSNQDLPYELDKFGPIWYLRAARRNFVCFSYGLFSSRLFFGTTFFSFWRLRDCEAVLWLRSQDFLVMVFFSLQQASILPKDEPPQNLLGAPVVGSCIRILHLHPELTGMGANCKLFLSTSRIFRSKN